MRWKSRELGFVVLAFAVVGCASEPAPTVLPADHPANPRAAVAFTPPSDPFAEDAWLAPAPPASAMDHGAMDHGAMEEPPPAHPRPAALYSCPMHPEVQEPAAGSCPKCGMALEPVQPAEHPHKDHR